ncbi:LssY C-terminal domain-containing protein [Marinobacterium sp. YM272]|uniref:LssY C-terminal domain-containing protein n=1 Tax=Marinobacterium sp. YM272 TaxID=3421654 RepID=UPI003D7F89D1
MSVLLLLFTLTLGGCASFSPDPSVSSFRDRAKLQKKNNVTVEAAVLSREESQSLFGVDLFSRQIQPVWIRIRNNDSHPYWMIASGLDPEYFSPHEVAYSLHRWLQRGYNEEVDLYFTRHSFFNPIFPQTTRSGFFYVNLDEDEKELDVDLISKDETLFFDFYFELTGLKARSLKQIEQQSEKSEIRDLNEAQLRETLRKLPCCTTSEDGRVNGDPINLVLIGDSKHLFPPFVRRGWHYAEDSYLKSIWKTVNSFLFGKHYRYSPVSNLYYDGRKQDIALQKARGTIHQRNHLRLWLTDLRFNGKEVWVGQISRDIGVRFTTHTPTFTTHKIDSDIDETRTAFIEDMLFSRGLSRLGFVRGVGKKTMSQPGVNLTGDPYYTDGLRAVLEFDARPNNLEDVRFFDWREPPMRRMYSQ